ncbi:MAG: hypothetical protein V2J20_12350 [Wenzhouxiangella sp.]|nr:hypothetical protein [Wenzhouxiangella sp.]
MEWNELRAQWKNRQTETVPRPTRPGPAARIWDTVRRRDRLENAAALMTGLVFAACVIFFALAGLWMTSAFALLLVGSIAWIALRLGRARRQIPEPDPEQPVLLFMRAERAALETQARLMSSTFAWYWGPLAFGVIGFFASLRGIDPVSFGYALIVVFMGLGVEALNRAAVRKQIQPALEWVNEQISQLENES